MICRYGNCWDPHPTLLGTSRSPLAWVGLAGMGLLVPVTSQAVCFLIPAPLPPQNTKKPLGQVSPNWPLWPAGPHPPPSCFAVAPQPPDGVLVLWSVASLLPPPLQAGPEQTDGMVCPGPEAAPTFMRSSAFTLLPWISSTQKGCSRDHRHAEEGWVQSGERQ